MSRLLPVLLVIVAVVVFASTSPLQTPDSAAAAVTTFTFNGLEQTYPVPVGVTRVRIEAIGALGGSGGSVACGLAAGGVGGRVVVSDVPVVSGSTLFVYVGGQGLPGQNNGTAGFNGGGAGRTNAPATTNGGGGGGASDVRQGGNAIANRIVIGAGGGGGGGCGAPGLTDDGGVGGSGGALAGDGGAGAAGQSGLAGVGGGGGGGTQVVGGAAGSGTNAALALPTAGTLAQGGIGGGNNQAPPGGSGGGGGGGRFGGGGGGAGFGDNANAGGGGGGGGSNLAAAGTVVTNGVNATGDTSARVIITTLDSGLFTKTFTPASIQVSTNTTLSFSLTNPNATPLTGASFTDDFSAQAITIVGGLTSTCGGTTTAVVGTSILSLVNGTIPTAGCAISVTVTSATTGTKVNTTGLLSTNEAPAIGPVSATLIVTAAPVTPVAIPSATPTSTPTVIIPPAPIIIPQVFQNPAVMGIFTNPRPNTPTPVVRAVAVAPVVFDPGVMPVISPPRTGDAGLLSALRLPSIW